jgi:hypothetical protein
VFSDSRKTIYSNKKRRTAMNQDNRVLSRIGARELSEQEVEAVTGGLKIAHTLSPCFVDKNKQLFAGDTSECGDV